MVLAMPPLPPVLPVLAAPPMYWSASLLTTPSMPDGRPASPASLSISTGGKKRLASRIGLLGKVKVRMDLDWRRHLPLHPP